MRISPICALHRLTCLGYANLQQRQRRLRRGYWCNSVRTNLFEAIYMPADIHLISRHRRNCDRRKQGRFRRGYMDVFTPCHRIACAKSAPQVIGYTVAGSYDSRCSSGLKSCRFGFQTQSILLQKQPKSGFCCLCQKLDLWLIVFKFSTGYCITNSNI